MRKESCISGTIPGWIRRLAPVLVAVCLTSCIKDRIPQGADLEAGDRLPEFSVTMDDGSTISTADMLGGISCIVFFHTGCPDCQNYNLFATYAVPRIYISDIDGVIRSIWTDNPLPTFDELETALLDAMPFGMNPNEFQKKMADQPS